MMTNDWHKDCSSCPLAAEQQHNQQRNQSRSSSTVLGTTNSRGAVLDWGQSLPSNKPSNNQSYSTMIKSRATGVQTIRNPRSKKPSTGIRSSNLVLGILGCVLGGAILLFGTSLHFISSQSATDNASQVDQQNNKINHRHAASQSLNRGAPAQIPLESAKMALQTVKAEFYDRYGGKNAAEEMQSKTITAYGSIQETADRILRAIAQQDDFVMGFAGYSITVGRGNFFNQSFPFVVERVLKDPMKALGVPNFYVRNSAIGG